MVGTPGRSKACQPCKKRRVACDFAKPACSRCIKAKRLCEYAQARIFVQHQSGSYKSVYRKEDGQKADRDVAVDTAATSSGRHSTAQIRDMVLLNQPQTSFLQQQGLLSDALDSNRLPNSHGLKEYTFDLTDGLSDSCLHLAYLACYTSWVGRREQNQRLIDASRGFYVEALRDAHKALDSSDKVLADSTLGACSALGIYEALECPEGNLQAYFWHRAACCRLIEMRGPEAHKDGTAHRLFLKMRFFAILKAFDSEEDTFLVRPEWMTIPFSVHPKRKFDELLDIFALGPQASRLGRSLGSLPADQVLPTALSIMGHLVVIYDKLQAFQSRLEDNGVSPQYWERALPLRSDAVAENVEDPEFVFAPSLWFPDLDTAALFTLLWSVQSMMWGGLLDLHDFYHEIGLRNLFDAAMKDMGGLTRQMMECLLLHKARMVLQSIAYCTTPVAVEAGPPRGVTQLAIVTSVLKHKRACEVEYEWASRAQKRLGEKYARILACDR